VLALLVYFILYEYDLKVQARFIMCKFTWRYYNIVYLY